MSASLSPSPHCVAIPFLGRLDSVVHCATEILSQRTPETMILLVDDGSEGDVRQSVSFRELLSHPQVHLIRHQENQGIAAARNSALHWCRRRGIDYVIMVDSDCFPYPGFLREHLSLREEFPQAACIGGGIVGTGESWVSRLDGYLTWPYSIPQGETREATSSLYNLPTANLALRPSRLPDRDFVFDERLPTNEDCLFIRELCRSGAQVLWAPTPLVLHQNRDNWRSVLDHHRQFGHSSYFVQLGADFSPRVFQRRHRALFVTAFGAALPIYALVGTTLAAVPWLRHDPRVLMALPAGALIFLMKGLAAMQTAVAPKKYLRQARSEVTYTELKAVAS